MTVSSTSNRVIYQGNGTTTVFPFAFKVQQAADLVVVYSDATGTAFTLSSGQYTASGFGLDAGGSVTYPVSGSPIATGSTLTIYRDVAPTQPTSISNQGAMWPQVIEAALDRLTFIVQKIADIASRALTISATDGDQLNPLPSKTLRANTYLHFDGNGQPEAVANLGVASVGAWLAANFLPQTTAAAALGALGGLATGVLTTTGDIFVRGASSIGRLAIGSTGQVLTVVGGTAAWAAAPGAYGRTTVADAAYTVVGTDYTVAYTSLTASRTITLPAASAFPAGKRLTITDEAGAATQTLQLSLAPNGSDTIAGYNTTQVCLNTPRGICTLYSNGTNGWVVEKWAVEYTAVPPNGVTSGFTSWQAICSVAQGSRGHWLVQACAEPAPASNTNIGVSVTDGAAVKMFGNTLGGNSYAWSYTVRIPDYVWKEPAGNLVLQHTTSGGVDSHISGSTSAYPDNGTYLRVVRVV